MLCLAWALSRGRSKVTRLKAELEAQGECFDLKALGLDERPVTDPTWAVLEAAAPVLETLQEARVSPLERREYEAARVHAPQVSWQQPYLYSLSQTVLEWDLAEEAASRLQPECERVYLALRDRSPLPGEDRPRWLPGKVINYASVRVVAQALQPLMMVELHRGNTAAAYTNLVTLVRFGRYHQEAWSLVPQMLRMAVFGLTTDALWQALQAPGWTEDQLATLQYELSRIDLVGPLSRTYEVERIGALRQLADYREGGPQHLRALYQSVGVTTARVDGWRQHVYFHYWRLFRQRDVEVQIIQDMQRLIDRARLFAQGYPVDTLPPDLTQDRRSRFQVWLDDWAGPGTGVFPVFSYNAAPDFGRTLSVVALREAQRRLALTALALERFRLATGRLPTSIEQLVPEYLDAVPTNPFDGASLHYERRPEDRFTVSYRDADGSVRRVRDERLLWPVVEPPLPLPEPIPRPEDSLSKERLPLVKFDEAPLADVIKMLARQAGMNVIFDPQLTLDQYPPVNVNLMDVTAFELLKAVLDNNNLRLECDPRTGIYRITR